MLFVLFEDNKDFDSGIVSSGNNAGLVERVLQVALDDLWCKSHIVEVLKYRLLEEEVIIELG